MTIPAVVSILDLGTAVVATAGMRFEASYTSAGVATTVQLDIGQLMTPAFGVLPTGGATGQVLGKSTGTDFAAAWVNPSSFVAANATSGLTVAGSTSLTLALASVAGLSVLGVSGATQAIATALVGTTAQIFGVNTSTAGFFAATTMMPGPFQTATLGAFGVAVAQGTSPLQVAAPSTAGNILIDQGAAANPAFRVVGGDLTMSSAGTATIGTNVVSYAKIQAGTGLAVLGFATTASSNVTAFVASAANQVLGVNAGATGLAWALPAQVLLNTLSPNNVATIGDVTSFTTAFRNYLVTFENVVPSNTTASLLLQVATTGTAFVATSYIANVFTNTGLGVGNDFTTAAILLSGTKATTNVGNGTTYGVNGHIMFFNPANATTRKTVIGQLGYLNGTAVTSTSVVGAMPSGFLDVANPLSGFQVSFSPGNIATGTIKVYGLT